MLNFKEWKSDVPAGLVVFLVALPLCLGIALACEAPLFSGIIAGIVGGVVVTLFSDSAVGVSGPAAGLVAIVVVAIGELGFEGFLLAVVIAGIVQVILGVMRLGIIGYYFPTAVITGMLAAIGLIILLKQIPHAVGYDADYEGDMTFEQFDGHNTFTELGYSMNAISVGATIICLVSLAILILWERPFMKRAKVSSVIQGPLVAVAVGIGLHLLFEQIGRFKLGPGQVVDLPVAADVGEFFGQFQFPDFRALAGSGVYLTGLTLAIVASLESLLCAEAADKLDPNRRTTDLNRELTAQGMGNIVSGMLGGLPVTQVIIRTSTNIQAGAKTRTASFVHGLLMLVCVALIPGLLNRIPLASLAAILLVVGFKLAHPSKFRAMFKLGPSQFVPFLTTVVAIVVTDLLQGIGIGLVASALFILQNNYQHSYWLHEQQTENGTRIRLVLSEHVSFLNKGSILKTLREIPPHSDVLIDASDSVYIDPDVLDILQDFEAKAAFKKIALEIRGIGDGGEVSRPVKAQLIPAPSEIELSA